MGAYYNEIEPFAAQWLRNLIAAGHIAPGDVDERSIEDVYPDDLRGYTQCHFFAGIGVWSYALRRAGWPDDRPVWTGSCPCQPFSSAGKGAAFDDERHLWPAFHHLIKECRPAALFGEQVASRDADTWIDLVQDDLEAMGYAVGAVPFPSAGVGAPHIRDRLYWMAYADHSGRLGRRAGQKGDGRDAARVEPQRLRNAGGLADAERERVRPCGSGSPSGETGAVQGIDGERQRLRLDASAGDDGMGARPGPTNGFWRAADWLACRDGKWRPVSPKPQPLVDGSAESLGRVRAGTIEEIEKEINALAMETKIDRVEALRNVLESFRTQSHACWEAGRIPRLHEAPFLLAFVRQLAQQGWGVAQCLLASGQEAIETELRMLRNGRTAAGASCQYGLEGQPARECADALHFLPPLLARHAHSAWGQAYRAYAETGFPLTQNAASRVGRLRAYGNAINAEAARVFIESAMDCMP